jgi:hypothetical protein
MRRGVLQILVSCGAFIAYTTGHLFFPRLLHEIIQVDQNFDISEWLLSEVGAPSACTFFFLRHLRTDQRDVSFPSL